MDYLPHFRREAGAFTAAVREAAGHDVAPAVPSCPGWNMTDLVLHLGQVHRSVGRVVRDRIQERPAMDGDRSWLGLPPGQLSWLPPGQAPADAPVPASLAGWFAAGAGELAALFAATAPGERVWSWSPDQTSGFWQRMQTIELAVHRWDAQAALGPPEPVDAELATDAVGQTFEVMVPMRRAWRQAPAGAGERFLFTRSDGPGEWAVRFDGDRVVAGEPAGPPGIRLAGTASDLMLFLWHRVGPDALTVTGDAALASRYFELVPPV